jgi:hypothetical protein
LVGDFRQNSGSSRSGFVPHSFAVANGIGELDRADLA